MLFATDDTHGHEAEVLTGAARAHEQSVVSGPLVDMTQA